MHSSAATHVVQVDAFARELKRRGLARDKGETLGKRTSKGEARAADERADALDDDESAKAPQRAGGARPAGGIEHAEHAGARREGPRLAEVAPARGRADRRRDAEGAGAGGAVEVGKLRGDGELAAGVHDVGGEAELAAVRGVKVHRGAAEDEVGDEVGVRGGLHERDVGLWRRRRRRRRWRWRWR